MLRRALEALGSVEAGSPFAMWQSEQLALHSCAPREFELTAPRGILVPS